MTDVDLPRVLFIDDGTSTTVGKLREALEPEGVTLHLLHPEVVEDADLQRSDLVVVDYFLDDWAERDAVHAAPRAPRDGLAVAATLRSRLLPQRELRTAGLADVRPVAFALWSAHLGAATFQLPSAVRAHVFARENNLEWAFVRERVTSGAAAVQVGELARAVVALPERWPGRSAGAAAVEMLGSLLAVPKQSWADLAVEQVMECRPPVFELSERTHGLVLLRWLLHRILPYPTFLIDEQYLCARLRLDALPEDPEAELWKALAPTQYTGPLNHFDERRWWRAGVEHWLWEVTDGRSGNPEAVRSASTLRGGVALREWHQPVVVTGPDLERRPGFVEIGDTLRLRPDDWPPFADEAYAELAHVKAEPSLAAIVDVADRDRLADGRE